MSASKPYITPADNPAQHGGIRSPDLLAQAEPGESRPALERGDEMIEPLTVARQLAIDGAVVREITQEEVGVVMTVPTPCRCRSANAVSDSETELEPSSTAGTRWLWRSMN